MPKTATVGRSNHNNSGNARESSWTLCGLGTEAGAESLAAVNSGALSATI